MYKYKNLCKAAMTFIFYTLFANWVVSNTADSFDKSYVWTVLIIAGTVLIFLIAKGKIKLIDKEAKDV